jgi:hypothetical protein
MRPSLGIISGAFALRSHSFARGGHVVFSFSGCLNRGRFTESFARVIGPAVMIASSTGDDPSNQLAC